MFVYTSHAEQRIEQRNLSVAQIEETVLQPDKVFAGFKQRMLARRDFSGNILEVIYRRQEDNIIIITAYWMDE